jgi:hypothetical protein
MPNDITNKLEILNNDFSIDLLLSIDTKDNKYFDFNKIIPMPDELNIKSDNLIMLLENEFSVKDSLKEKLDELKNCFNNNIEELNNKIENFCQGIKNYIKYDNATWYSWSYNNWGTKWNSYNNKIQDNIIIFNTAWSSPIPIFFALLKKYPNIKFKFEYADEDTGNNCGYGFTENAELKIIKFENQSQEAIKLFLKFNPDRLKCFNINDDFYTFKDCENCNGCDDI